MKFDLGCIIGSSGGRLAAGPAEGTIEGFATDSRHKGEGWLFVALKGERVDGHDYLEDASRNGAKAALVSRLPDRLPSGMSVILTDDALVALGKVAAMHRRRFDLPVFGVTGSAGKTTTKDMTAAVLSRKYEVLKTIGNLNGEIGCPLTLLNLEPRHEVAVIEMAMRGAGQIRNLAEMALPDKGIVTIVGSMHMEFLGSKEGIAKAKAELVEALPAGGLAILNRDDDMVYGMSSLSRCPWLTYGFGHGSDLMASDVSYDKQGSSFDIKLSGKAKSVLGLDLDEIKGLRVPFAGSHQVRNALAATCAGLSEGVLPDDIIAALADFRPSAMRMGVKHALAGFEVLDDTYNANPESVPAAADSAIALAAGRPLYLVLGGMVELGETSLKMHHELGGKLARLPVAGIVTMGLLGHGIFEGLEAAGYKDAVHTQTHEEAADKIVRIAPKGALVLVKGSRSIGMDKVVSILTGITESAH